jgi:hypothetical protein
VVNVDVLADTEFRDRAINALDEFTHEHGCPVHRTQIQQLRQIAFNQPGEVPGFADHQRKKAEKRRQGSNPNSDKAARLVHEIAFWNLIVHLCGSANTPAGRWSLYRLAEEQSPADCHVGKKPHGSASPEERRAYQEAKQKSDAWQKQRVAEDYPAFFQRFCAHYLYRLSKQEAGDRRDDL